MGNVILLVEDDEPIRDMFKFALEIVGYEVFVAKNGREGLEILPQIPFPDLILLDLMMPVLDGWGFVAALDTLPQYSPIPIVVVTAFELKDRPIRANRVLNKPVELDQLYEAVREYCTPNKIMES